MFKPLVRERTRRKKTNELKAYINSVYDAELKGVSGEEQRKEAYEVARAQVLYEENDLDVLLQQKLLSQLDKAGIEVPDEYWNGEEWPLQRTLLPQGEKWARRQLRRYRDERIEFWSKLVVPILALIISIIALFVRSR